MTDHTLLINNLRGAAKVEDIALFQECEKMGFVSDQATTFSTNGKLLREAADAIASLSRDLEEAREIIGQRLMTVDDDGNVHQIECEHCASLRREVLEAIEPFAKAETYGGAIYPDGVYSLSFQPSERQLTGADIRKLGTLASRISRAQPEGDS